MYDFIKHQGISHQTIAVPFKNNLNGTLELKFNFIEDNKAIIGVSNTSDLSRCIETLEYKASISDNALSHVNEAIIGFNSEGGIEYLSHAAERLFHITLEEICMDDVFLFFNKASRAPIRNAIYELVYHGNQIIIDLTCVDDKGRYFPASTVWWQSISDKLDMYFVHISDLTLLRNFMNDVDGCFIRVDEHATIIDANHKTFPIFTKTRSEIVGSTIAALEISSTNDHLKFSHPEELVNLEKSCSVSIPNNNSEPAICEINAWPQEIQNGRIYNIVIHDVTDKKRNERKLRESAYNDSLTGLYNRHYFMEFLNKTIRDQRSASSGFTLMMLDLDGFKQVNDNYGHLYGDELLKIVSHRLLECVRDNDLVARLGGDEFILLIHGLTEHDKLEHIAQRTITHINKETNIIDRKIKISTSLGISRFPNDSTDIDELIKLSDTAMYSAKNQGKNNYRFFAPNLSNERDRIKHINNTLFNSLNTEEFYLAFQPKVIAPEMQIYGLEALIRWNSPDYGPITPEEFIHIAERNGAIYEIDQWVINNTIKQWNSWTANSSILRKYLTDISINISAQHCNNDLLHHIKNSLAQCSIPADSINIEITESALMDNFEESIRVLNDLKTLGIKISIDDFGVGYSSLKYLKDLPLDSVKIDRSFTKDIHKFDKNRFVIEAVIEMARKFNLDVIAEGVETQDELDCLIEIGCLKFQGYFFSKPLASDKILPYVLNNLSNIKIQMQ